MILQFASKSFDEKNYTLQLTVKIAKLICKQKSERLRELAKDVELLR